MGRQDSILWQSKRPFELITLDAWDVAQNKPDPNKPQAQWYPFYRTLPMKSVADSYGRHIISTRPLRDDVRFGLFPGTDYKPMFQYLDGAQEKIDPHIGASEGS